MTSVADPIPDHASPIQRLARVFQRLIRRAAQIDLAYVDPWERRRR